MKDKTIEAILSHRIIAIVRGQSRENVLRIGEALYAGGIRLMEITYSANAPETDAQTAETVKALVSRMPSDFYVGSGTVLTARQVELTHEAGGKYIISPNVNTDVIRRTVSLGLASLPGAMTPTECVTAHDAGADFVKLFPIGNLGTSYLKALAAPLSHIRFLAVGGVSPETLEGYFKAGAVGVGTGGDLVNSMHVQNGRFDLIEARAREYVAALPKRA